MLCSGARACGRVCCGCECSCITPPRPRKAADEEDDEEGNWNDDSPGMDDALPEEEGPLLPPAKIEMPLCAASPAKVRGTTEADEAPPATALTPLERLIALVSRGGLEERGGSPLLLALLPPLPVCEGLRPRTGGAC